MNPSRPFPSSSRSPAAAASRRATSPTSTPAERKARLEELGLPGLPRQAAVHALLLPARRRPRADDRPAGRPARRAGRGTAAAPDDAAAHARGRQGHHPQDAVEALRRRARRVGADALPRPGHDVRLQPGRLRHGLPVLRDRPGRPAAQHVHRARSSSRSSPAPASLARDEVPGGPGRVSNVVFMGMGEPMANYKAVIGAVRRLTDPTPDGLGMSARGITVSTVGLVPRINQLDRGGHPGHPRAEPARPRRRAARRAGAGQHPLEGGRGRRGGLELRADHQAPGLDRVRHDARHQRPGAGAPTCSATCSTPTATGAGCTST